jgi:predicted nucleic-acid-binding protein
VASRFVNTNILLRYLLDDIPKQADAAEAIIEEAAAGKLTLQTNVMVIAELVWTCESYYRLPREEIRDKVLMILNTPGLEVEDKDFIAEAILLYVDRNVDFIDAYNGCWMRAQGITQVYTFDESHYKRLEGIEVLVPGA